MIAHPDIPCTFDQPLGIGYMMELIDRTVFVRAVDDLRDVSMPEGQS